jgi:hypothetical protein
MSAVCVRSVLAGCLLALIVVGKAGAESVTGLLPALADKLSNTLGLPQSGPPPNELVTLQQVTRVPFFRGPESPTASFSFVFDKELGLPVARSEGLGPFYAQRPDTLGKGRFSLGVTYTRADFRELDGVNLDRVTVTLDGPIEMRVAATIQVDAINFQATYGLIDSLDLAVAIPIVHQFVRLKGSMTADFGSASAQVSREVAGLGDILVSAKYRAYDSEAFLLAARLELSLPTGDERDFLGFGTTQVSPMIIATGKLGFGIVPHLNVGLHFSADTDKVEHQLFYVVGLDWNALKWVTLSASVLGTHIIDNKRPALSQSSGIGIPVRSSSDDILDLGVGFKARVWRKLVITGGVLVPLNSTGLRARAIPSFGLELPF